MPIDIVIGGDIFPSQENLPFFEHADSKAIFGGLLDEFQSAAFSVVNLEAPFISKFTPILKTGNNFGLAPACIQGIVSAQIRCVNLANNHILDQGADGLEETISVCNRAGIEWVGAGRNLNEAQKPLLKSLKGMRVAFVSMADLEFSIAGDDSWGANPLDLIEFVRTVRSFKGQYDYLIVLIHGGAEHYPYPSPRTQKFSRFIVEEGANAVIWQHSHCPGTIEWYESAPIVYGQGNLIADSLIKKRIAWHQGSW